MEDQRTDSLRSLQADEALVTDSRSGDTNALNILFRRYIERLHFYLLKDSWFKDNFYLDDLIQQILLIAFKKIKDGQSFSQDAGSFRKWLYTIAHLECLKQDKKRSLEPEPISRRYPDESTGIAEDEIIAITSGLDDHYQTCQRLQMVFKCLSMKEIRLMLLIANGKTYQEIRQLPEFNKYSLDYLMRKVYIIRQKANTIKEEQEDEK